MNSRQQEPKFRLRGLDLQSPKGDWSGGCRGFNRREQATLINLNSNAVTAEWLTRDDACYNVIRFIIFESGVVMRSDSITYKRESACSRDGCHRLPLESRAFTIRTRSYTPVICVLTNTARRSNPP
jgi:hypothetical protein